MDEFERISGKSAGEFFKGYNRAECEYIVETARLLSQNDPEVVKRIEYAVDDPEGYFGDADEDFYFFFFVNNGEKKPCYALYEAMVYELCECGYLASVKWRCVPELFRQELSELKTYYLIKGVVSRVKLPEEFCVPDWCQKINRRLRGRVCICSIDFLGDYSLMILDGASLEKVRSLSEDNRKLISAY